MQGKHEVRTVERVPLEVLQQQAYDYTEDDAYAPERDTVSKTWETGTRFRTCSVYDFYEPFLLERRADAEETRIVLKWITDSIEVMLGEKDAGTLTMEELASKIAEVLNQEDTADEDRWALYELCFLLTAQMCTLKDEYFGMREQSIRWGTPDEEEPRSLYERVSALRRIRNSSQTQEAPTVRVSLEKLLQVARGSGHELSERARLSLPGLTAGPVMKCLLTAKYNVNDAPDEMLALLEKTERFEEMFRTCTGEELDESSSISELATAMTWKFKLEAENCNVSRMQVLQAYELCYEFINLLADEEHDTGHTSLMERSAIWTEHQT